jgi:DedD protein
LKGVRAKWPPPLWRQRRRLQVGAFSDEAKAREARQKLERAGITTYTQAVQTKDGMRTRVRVGPFQGREQAEKASAKIKALGLPAAILTL